MVEDGDMMTKDDLAVRICGLFTIDVIFSFNVSDYRSNLCQYYRSLNGS